MSDLLVYLVPGVVAGSIYALAGLGLVLTYRTTGILNFAHGAVATCITYVFFVTLRADLGMPTALAFVLTIGVIAPGLGLLLHFVVFRWLSEATTATRVVATLGLLVALQGTVLKTYTGETRTAPALFPLSTFRLPGVNVGWDQAIVFLIAIAAVWPVTYATAAGLAKVDPAWFKVARNLGARPVHMLTQVILPAIAFDIFTGIRLALGVAWVVLVPAELLGVTSGLGYAIRDARETLSYNHLTAMVLVIGVIGWIFDAVCVSLIKRYSWHHRGSEC